MKGGHVRVPDEEARHSTKGTGLLSRHLPNANQIGVRGLVTGERGMFVSYPMVRLAPHSTERTGLFIPPYSVGESNGVSCLATGPANEPKTNTLALESESQKGTINM